MNLSFPFDQEGDIPITIILTTPKSNAPMDTTSFILIYNTESSWNYDIRFGTGLAEGVALFTENELEPDKGNNVTGRITSVINLQLLQWHNHKLEFKSGLVIESGTLDFHTPDTCISYFVVFSLIVSKARQTCYSHHAKCINLLPHRALFFQ